MEHQVEAFAAVATPQAGKNRLETVESKWDAIEGYYATLFGLFPDPEELDYAGIYKGCEECFKRLSTKYNTALAEMEVKVAVLKTNAEAPLRGPQQSNALKSEREKIKELRMGLA